MYKNETNKQPTSNFDGKHEPKNSEVKLITIAIVLSLASLVANYNVGIRIGGLSNPSQLDGYTVGGVMFGIIVVSLFLIGKRFRNVRSSLIVYCSVLVFLLIGNGYHLIGLIK